VRQHVGAQLCFDAWPTRTVVHVAMLSVRSFGLHCTTVPTLLHGRALFFLAHLHSRGFV